MTVLVVCGGPLDRAVLLEAGLQRVTISNLGEPGEDYAPYSYATQDAEELTCRDGEYDVVIVHSGLHHCRSPHRALLEMYRVARRGILVVEARDSFTMRCACWLGFALDYELPAVSENSWRAGGVRNTPIPNYVYRWTEREVLKTLAAYQPECRPQCRFFYDLEIPWELVALQGQGRWIALRLLSPILLLWAGMFRRQGNRFAFWARKAEFPADLQPWLRIEDQQVVPNRAHWTLRTPRASSRV